jgi:hypothetical protein
MGILIYFSHHSSVDREVREYVEYFARTTIDKTILAHQHLNWELTLEQLMKWFKLTQLIVLLH